MSSPAVRRSASTYLVEQVADPLGAVIVDEEARAVLRADLPVAVVVVQFDEPADDVVRLVRGHEHVQRAGDAGVSPAEPAADAHVEAERLPAVDLFFAGSSPMSLIASCAPPSASRRC